MKTKTLEILIVLTVLLMLALSFVFKYEADKAEANKPNDYDELVVVVQKLQKMVGALIDAGNTHKKRITDIENRASLADSFICFMLSEHIEVDGEKLNIATADERLSLIRDVFEMMNENEKKIDPNLFFTNYEKVLGAVYVEVMERPEPNENPLELIYTDTIYFLEPNEPNILEHPFVADGGIIEFMPETYESLLWVERNEKGKYDLPPKVVYWKDENGEITEYIPKPNESETIKIFEGQQFSYKDKLYIFCNEEFILIVDMKNKKLCPIEPNDFTMQISEFEFAPFPEQQEPIVIHTPSELITISKGTKIYFKED